MKIIIVVAENLSQRWPAAAGACRIGLYCCGSPDVVKLISKWLVLGAMQVVALELDVLSASKGW